MTQPPYRCEKREEDGATTARHDQLEMVEVVPAERAEEAERLLAEATKSPTLGNIARGVEAMARREYYVFQEEMGYEKVWEEETQGHRNIYLDAARERLNIALAAFGDQPTSDEGGSGAGADGDRSAGGSTASAVAAAAFSAAPASGAASTPTGGSPSGITALSLYGFDYWDEPGAGGA